MANRELSDRLESKIEFKAGRPPLGLALDKSIFASQFNNGLTHR